MANSNLSTEEAIHAMQSGVALDHKLDRDANGGTLLDDSDGSPKHLRVGVNMALIDSAAIAMVLIEKGLCTQEELEEQRRVLLNREVDSYEAELSVRLQRPVTLR